ncbi:MAG TPA: hypothetical protein VHW00_17100 [Thermoanaerobaculia bacterium]|nr:hypothetical protein [Thermoanaerobaculia bacterium]
MSGRETPSRNSPRVILRKARDGHFGEEPVLVLELGLAGAKFEHGTRLAIGTRATFVCGPVLAEGDVRHSILLPAESGIVYHTGIAFRNLTDEQQSHLYQLLIDEAQEQVNEWEANLQGLAWRPKPARKSAVVRRYVSLRKTPTGWLRTITIDPNQPIDGIAVPDDTPENELEILRRTYDSADKTMRELMRRMAMVGILERLR